MAKEVSRSAVRDVRQVEPLESLMEGQHVLSIGGVTGQQLSGIIKE